MESVSPRSVDWLIRFWTNWSNQCNGSMTFVWFLSRDPLSELFNLSRLTHQHAAVVKQHGLVVHDVPWSVGPLTSPILVYTVIWFCLVWSQLFPGSWLLEPCVNAHTTTTICSWPHLCFSPYRISLWPLQNGTNNLIWDFSFLTFRNRCDGDKYAGLPTFRTSVNSFNAVESAIKSEDIEKLVYFTINILRLKVAKIWITRS